ncbi:MAG: hypothetical protein K9L30_05310 [Desulfobacterales bacterium]|nr:hypothetical protein [Desulfobacterales bacterium]
MNILYGVQTTGYGHISRSRELVRNLKTLGHHVHVVFSGQNASMRNDFDDFQPYKIFKGIRFYRDVRAYDVSGIDLVVTDFEPITARIGKKHNIPVIGVAHQYAFLHDIPMDGANPLAKWILRNFADVDIPVGLHWHHFGNSILPPIVPHDFKAGETSAADKIVVYLPFENMLDIGAALTSIKSHQFYIYCKIDSPLNNSHIHWRPISRDDFLKDLSDCSGVICNSGFELVSEAIHVGKKVLVKPLSGQMEQFSNARALTELKLGQVMRTLNSNKIDGWLTEPQPDPICYPDVARIIAEWVDSKNWHDVDSLSRATWRKMGITV